VHRINIYLQVTKDALIPVMLAILVVTVLSHFARLRVAMKFLLLCAVAMFVTFVLAHINRWENLWSGHPGFPSGHMTLMTCTFTLLILLNARWIFAAVPLLCIFGWLLVHLHNHSWLDVIGAALFTPPVTLGCYAIFRRIQRRGEVFQNGLGAE